MAKILVLLIEDNRILREGISAMLAEYGNFSVTTVADGGKSSLTKARAVKPDVALIDFSLATHNSVDIVASLRKEFPEIKIIGMGLAPSQADILEFVQAGADGFILKTATVDDVIKTIRTVAEGEKVLPPPLTGSLFAQVTEHALLSGKKNLGRAVRMTKRENEVVALIIEGLSNKEIATKLHIATFTVKSHVHNILEKLALNSRLQIALHSHNKKMV